MDNQVLDDLRRDLLHNHWVDTYDWVGIENSLETVARLHDCSVETVRSVMRDIEQDHPEKKPQTWRDVEFRKPCRTCGKVIGFARTDKGNLMPVNLDDFTTHWDCEKPAKPKKGK